MNEQERIQVEMAKRALLMRVLDKGAFERLARVRIANPNLAEQVEMYLIQRAQTNPERVTESKLKELLNLLVKKRKTKIMRR